MLCFLFIPTIILILDNNSSLLSGFTAELVMINSADVNQGINLLYNMNANPFFYYNR